MKLFINEFIKDYKKISTYIYLLISFMLISIVNFSYYKQEMQPSGEEILSETFTLISTLGVLFALIIFANNITSEYTKGTIKLLYSKPKSRSKILTAKIILAVVNTIIFILVNFVFDFLTKKFIFFKTKINFHTIWTKELSGNYTYTTFYENISMQFLFSLILAICYIALVLFICVLFKKSVISVCIVLFMILGSGPINYLTSFLTGKYEFVKYIFTNIAYIPAYFTNNEAKRMLNEKSLLSSRELLIMALCYTVFFIVISYIVNSRRDIK